MDQRARSDEYANVISNQLEAIEALEANSDATRKKNLEEAIMWYNKFLGFQVVEGSETSKYERSGESERWRDASVGDGVVGKREEGGAEGGGSRRAIGDLPLTRRALRRHPPAKLDEDGTSPYRPGWGRRRKKRAALVLGEKEGGRPCAETRVKRPQRSCSPCVGGSSKTPCPARRSLRTAPLQRESVEIDGTCMKY